jgi:hypothetical protein
MSDEQKREVYRRRPLALRGDGQVVEIGYRAAAADKIFCAASWMHRAVLAKNPASASAERKWLAIADEVYEGDYKLEDGTDWYKDSGAGFLGKMGAYNMALLTPGDAGEKYHSELQYYCTSFVTYKQTPGGLRFRSGQAHEYGSLRHANNAAVVAAYYSRLVEGSPKLSGNTWWKGDKTNAQLRDEYFAAARSQVDYALGANPYGRSYVVGFGHRPFNHPHHRGAYGGGPGSTTSSPASPSTARRPAATCSTARWSPARTTRTCSPTSGSTPTTPSATPRTRAARSSCRASATRSRPARSRSSWSWIPSSTRWRWTTTPASPPASRC